MDTNIKRIVEVSGVHFSAEDNKTFYKESRYDLNPDGSKTIKDFSAGELTVNDAEGNPVAGDTSADDVLTYVKSRVAADEVDEVVASETQTTTDVPAPAKE